MKHFYIIAVITLSLFSIRSMAACPDLSGNYRSDADDGSGFIKDTITQTACASLLEEYDQGWGVTVKHNHIFDGNKRLVEQDDDLKVYETSKIDESGVQILEERDALDGDGNPEVLFVDIQILATEAKGIKITRKFRDANGTVTDTDETVYARVQ